MMSTVTNTINHNNEPAPNTTASGKWARWVRLLSVLVIVGSLLALTRLMPMGRLTDMLGAAIQDMGIWGPVIFVLVYIVATVFMLPGSPLTLAAGAIFGLAWGTAAVSVGSTTGAALAFLISRYFARKSVEQKMSGSKTFKAVDRAVSEGGWKIVALLRLSPAVPFNLQNYLYGLTAIRFWPCVLASWAAMLPGTFMYVYLGYIGRAGVAAAAGEGGGKTPAQWAMLGVGLLATIAVTIYVTKLARRAIARQTDNIDDATDVSKEDAAMPAQKSASGWVTTVYAASALLAVTLAGCAYVNQSAFKSLFGPPEATLTETYSDNPDGPSFDHSAFDALLKQYVNEKGGVDYAGLQGKRDDLQAYIDRLAKAPFDDLGRDEKLTLLINGYNAFTLELILEHYNNGDLKSIKDIPSEKRWDDQRWQIAGKTVSLNQIEHELVRPNFKEPRIHWALVCAAVGCPPLRNEAYTASRLEEQLAGQANYVHSHDKWYRLDQADNNVHLTQLYNWYGGDFEQVAGSVLDYVADFDPTLKQMLGNGTAPRIRWLDYDWALNSQENIP